MSGGNLFERLAGRLADEPPGAQASGAQASAPAFAVIDLLELPADERTVLRHIMRRATPPTPALLAEELAGTVVDVASTTAALVARGALALDGDRVAVPTMPLARRRSPGGIWDRLGDL